RDGEVEAVDEVLLVGGPGGQVGWELVLLGDADVDRPVLHPRHRPLGQLDGLGPQGVQDDAGRRHAGTSARAAATSSAPAGSPPEPPRARNSTLPAGPRSGDAIRRVITIP